MDQPMALAWHNHKNRHSWSIYQKCNLLPEKSPGGIPERISWDTPEWNPWLNFLEKSKNEIPGGFFNRIIRWNFRWNIWQNLQRNSWWNPPGEIHILTVAELARRNFWRSPQMELQMKSSEDIPGRILQRNSWRILTGTSGGISGGDTWSNLQRRNLQRTILEELPEGNSITK